jgi:hypothetical protein
VDAERQAVRAALLAAIATDHAQAVATRAAVAA